MAEQLGFMSDPTYQRTTDSMIKLIRSVKKAANSSHYEQLKSNMREVK